MESTPLERSAELAALEALVGAAVEGDGGLVVVEGPAGIGKSRLLAETVASAEFLGARVLRARGMELERAFAFGVALQLFEPAVRALSEEDRGMVLRGAAALALPLVAPDHAERLPAEQQELALIHGVYWLAANLAERQPLLLLVDDAHWADEPSLRLCAYLAQRIPELPIALVVATRPGEDGATGELLAALRALPHARLLEPAPLSVAAVGTLVHDALGRVPDARFVAACERLTGGNPYLVSALLAAAQADGMRGTPDDGEQLARLAPQGVLRAVAGRLSALPQAAGDLARAVAILGDDAHLRHAAALAGLELADAAAAADRLAAADVLEPGEPLAFRHPLTASAVDREIPAATRASAHLRAAALLRDDGAPPERLAAHLLAAPPTGQAWVVDALARAAERSLQVGAPASAAAELRRALEEPPAPDARAALLVALGRAEGRIGEPAAARRLEAAVALTSEPTAKAQILRELARTRANAGDHAGGRRAYAEALDALNGTDPELRRHLQAEDLVMAALDPAHRFDGPAAAALLRDERVGETATGRALLATLTAHELYAGAPRERVLALADRALGGGALLHDEGARETSLYGVVIALFICEQLSRLEVLLTDIIETARRDGEVMVVASGSYSRAWARLLGGRVTDAIDDAQQAVHAGAHGWRMFLAGAYGCLTHALLDAGDVDAAEEHVRRAQDLVDAEHPQSIQLLDARGRVHAARGRHADAVADFLAAGELAGDQRNPLLFATWRSNAALALVRLGERDRAREHALTELELAQAFGAPRGIGVALRALGVVEGGEAGLRHLHASVEALDGSEALLEVLRSKAELGAALRRAGRRTEAGRLLGEALEGAQAAGAGEVERRATAELEVAGARAGKAARRGRAALSPGERRVVRLAASGMTNREIAEELFVTRKAVEWHLHNAYGKLGISSRKELPEALGAAT